jgi:hypothetical protein
VQIIRRAMEKTAVVERIPGDGPQFHSSGGESCEQVSPRPNASYRGISWKSY